MMRKTEPWIGSIVLLSVLLTVLPAAMAQETPAAPAAGSSLLEAIPKDATAFFAIRNLKELDGKITAFAGKLDFKLGGEGAMWPAPLTWVKETLQIGNGLDENGGVAVVLLNCANVKTSGEAMTRMALFLPTTKPDAMAEALGGQKQENAYSLLLAGQPMLATAGKNHLVLAQTPDSLREALKSGGGVGQSMSKDRIAAFGQDDLFGWVNFRGVSPDLRKEIENALTGLVNLGGTVDPTAAAEGAKNLTKWLEEGDVVAFSVRIDAQKGVLLSGYSALKPDTEYGRILAGTKPPTEPLLIGLPDESVICAFGSGSNGSVPGVEEQIRKGLDQALSEEMLTSIISPENLKSFKDELVKLLVQVDAINLSMAGLPAESGDGMIGLLSVVTVKDSRKWQAQARSLFATVKNMIVKAAQQPDITEEELKAVEAAIQIKENAETLGTAAVDHFVIDLAQIPDLTEDDIAEVKAVIGKEGILVRIAAMDPTHVVISFGGGVKRCQAVIGNVSEAKAPLADNKFIKMVADRLPKGPRLSEGYLHLENLLTLVVAISNQLNTPFPFPLAIPETAPLSLSSVKVGDTAQQIDILIPMEAILAAKRALEPLMGMLMGGMMGGPQGGMDMPVEPLEDEGGGELN